MNGNNGKSKEQFTKVFLSLLESRAWKKLGVNEKRFLEYLMVQNMRRAGRINGEITAPHRELVDSGIGGRFISKVISNLEGRGLIKRFRHDAYSPHTYALTWLSCRGAPPTNEWKLYSGTPLAGTDPTGEACQKVQHDHVKRCSTGAKNGFPDSEQFQDVARPVLHQGAAIYRSSYQGSEDSRLLELGIEGRDSPPADPDAAAKLMAGRVTTQQHGCRAKAKRFGFEIAKLERACAAQHHDDHHPRLRDGAAFPKKEPIP